MSVRLISVIAALITGLTGTVWSAVITPTEKGAPITSAVIEIRAQDDTSLAVALPRLMESTRETATTSLMTRGEAGATIWMKFAVAGTDSNNHDYVIRFEQTYSDYIDLWVVKNGVVTGPWRTGTHAGSAERSIRTTIKALPLVLHESDTATVIVRFAGRSYKLVGDLPVVQYRSTLEDDSSRSMYFNGLFFGLVFALLMYNLFIYMWTRERAYLAYVFSTLTAFVWMFAFENLPNVVLPQMFGELSTMFTFAGAAFGAFSGTWFAAELLNTKRVAPRYHRVLVWFYAFSFVYGVVLVIAPYPPFMDGVNLLGLVQATLVTVAGVIAYRKNVRVAKFFLLAFGILLVSLAYWTMTNLQIVPRLFDGFMSLRIGSAVELLVLSLALADRLNTMRAEKEVAQRAALEAELYRIRNVELEEANNRSNRLLLNVLPAAIADRIKAGEQRIAEAYDNVAVVFADIAQFTVWSAQLSATQTVEYLDMVFSALDELTERHGLEKIKTIGDCYMVVCGVPDPVSDPCAVAARYALELRELIKHLEPIPLSGGEPLRMRVGMDYGHVVAGVIGRKKFSFDLWGDVVNTAARMESHGQAGEILCTEAVAGKLQDRFILEKQPMMEIKGKGMMATFILRSENH